MKKAFLVLGLIIFIVSSCNSTQKDKPLEKELNYPDVSIVGAMRNVMWKGELESDINLDTISDKVGLYGLGPVVYLSGEILIIDGQTYVSKVISESTMSVEKKADVSAPFFVYANVREWNETKLPLSIKTIQDLEVYIDSLTKSYKRPFAFKITGQIQSALIHIQNLPKGAKVSSPKEAHLGQVKYRLENENVDIIGFFSTEHQGVFTHHDSFLHMHLITSDKGKMGHLDELMIAKMQLLLPVK